MALSRASKQYLGVRAILPPDLVTANRAPTSSDKAYVKGTLWLDLADLSAFMWPGTGNWIALGTGATGGVVTINSNASVGGNYVLAGTANQITITQTAGTSTFTIPAVFIAPGSIASTTTITSGTALIATTTIAAGTSITAGTSVTATLGNITATNGNLVLTAAGNKMIRSSVGTTTAAGANSIGTVTLVGGTATVATTAVTSSSLIKIWRQSIGATGAAALGELTVGTITNATSFVINAALTATATSLATTDVSVVGWEIIN